MEEQRHFVVYERVSTTRQDKKNHPDLTIEELKQLDIDNQTYYVREFMKKHPEYQPVTKVLEDSIYSDRASGTSLSGRTGFVKMEQRIYDYTQKPFVDTVLVLTVDRLGRNDYDLVHILMEYQQKKIHVIQIKEYDQINEITNFDKHKELESDFASMEYFFEIAMAAYSSSFFSKNISRSSLSGIDRKIQNHIYYFGGTPKYGYKWVGHEPKYYDDPDYKAGIRDRYVIKEDEAEIVRFIFNEYVKEKSGIGIILRQLVEKGVRRRGKYPTRKFVMDILSSRCYFDGSITIRQDHAMTSRKFVKNKIYLEAKEKSEKTKKPIEECMPSRQEVMKIAKDSARKEDACNQTITSYPDGTPIFPIIMTMDNAKELFDKAQEQAAKRKSDYLHGPNQGSAPLMKKGDAMLSGLLFCQCGSPMYSKGRPFYINKKGKRVPGGYSSTCHIKHKECKNSTFVSFAIDDVIWNQLFEHVKTKDLEKAIEKYWNGKASASTIENREATIKDLENDKETAEKVYAGASEAAALRPSKFMEDNRKKRQKELDEINAKIAKLKNESGDPEDKKKQLQQNLSAIKAWTMQQLMNANQIGIIDAFSLGNKDKEFRRRMTLEFISKIIYSHPSNDRKAPKLFTVIYRNPNGDNTDQECLKFKGAIENNLIGQLKGDLMSMSGRGLR